MAWLCLAWLCLAHQDTGSSPPPFVFLSSSSGRLFPLVSFFLPLSLFSFLLLLAMNQRLRLNYVTSLVHKIWIFKTCFSSSMNSFPTSFQLLLAGSLLFFAAAIYGIVYSNITGAALSRDMVLLSWFLLKIYIGRVVYFDLLGCQQWKSQKSYIKMSGMSSSICWYHFDGTVCSIAQNFNHWKGNVLFEHPLFHWTYTFRTA